MILQKQFLVLIFIVTSIASCQTPPNSKKMNDSKVTNNPLLCDLETGICEFPDNEANAQKINTSAATSHKIRIIYFTDPICSSCWGIEPQLRKLKLAYGEAINIEYRMGGLLPDWSYNSGGISKPSDVAHHWDEVSKHYDMPIDGDVWLEDPLSSSYPPSIAFKAAQLQDVSKAILFLREIREMVFIKKLNITKWEHLLDAAQKTGLDTHQFKIDFEGKARTLFEEDLNLARTYKVKGFPTMFFLDGVNVKETVYGARPYASYENAILKTLPKLVKKDYKKDYETIFSIYKSLTAREFSELTETPRNKSEFLLNELVQKNKLSSLTTKNGSIWALK